MAHRRRLIKRELSCPVHPAVIKTFRQSAKLGKAESTFSHASRRTSTSLSHNSLMGVTYMHENLYSLFNGSTRIFWDLYFCRSLFVSLANAPMIHSEIFDIISIIILDLQLFFIKHRACKGSLLFQLPEGCFVEAKKEVFYYIFVLFASCPFS